MKEKVLNSFFVGLGGASGSLLRYFVSLVLPSGIFPYSTLVINAGGSFVLGFITTSILFTKAKGWLRLLMGTGFCGGFTTMSTFSLELTLLPIEIAILYFSCSIISSLLLVMVGMKIAENSGRAKGEKV